LSVLVDVNVLLYAKFSDFPRHQDSRDWLEQALAGSEPVAIPWLCRIGFLRIATNGRVFERPLRVCEKVGHLLRAPISGCDCVVCGEISGHLLQQAPSISPQTPCLAR
jgi:hypothetical protein